MSKEIGPREKALREMREEKQADNERQQKDAGKLQADLKRAIDDATKKRGKPRKAKKK